MITRIEALVTQSDNGDIHIVTPSRVFATPLKSDYDKVKRKKEDLMGDTSRRGNKLPCRVCGGPTSLKYRRHDIYSVKCLVCSTDGFAVDSDTGQEK